MDSTVHEVRLSNWIKIVGACQSRPEGVTQRQWISEKCIWRNQVAAFAAMSGHGAERVAGLK